MVEPHHTDVIDCGTKDLAEQICEVAVVDSEGRMSDVLRVTGGGRVLASNAPFDYECLRSDAQRQSRNSQRLDDPDTWGCIMRARSARVGSPDHFYPLGAAHRAVGDAVAALAVLQAIAEGSGLQVNSPREGDPGSPVSLPPPDRSVQQRTVQGHIDLGTEHGHGRDDWDALPSSPEIQYRYCDRAGCSARKPHRFCPSRTREGPLPWHQAPHGATHRPQRQRCCNR